MSETACDSDNIPTTTVPREFPSVSDERDGRYSGDERDDDGAGATANRGEQETSRDGAAGELYRRVRVICWITTSPGNHGTRAKHVKATWGKRCNTLLFMSTVADKSLPAIALPVEEGANRLWGKTKEAFKYIHKHYDNYDYVLKADDDTYVIVENLRYMLTSYNPDDAIYLGGRFKPLASQGYVNSGAGYLLSKKSVKWFVEEAIPHNDCRQDDGGTEDLEMTKCLQLVGVKVEDSRDSFGRGRFFQFSLEQMFGSLDPKYRHGKKMYDPIDEGTNFCSDTAVLFHYVSPSSMYVFDYLIYHLRPFGISQNVDPNIMNDINLNVQSNITKIDRQVNNTQNV